MSLDTYLRNAELALSAEGRDQALTLVHRLDGLRPQPQQRDLYCYAVPELGEGGACSLFGALADEPYDLGPILGGRNTANDALLSLLDQAVDQVVAASGLEWLGIYQARHNVQGEPVLVKLAYRGAPSRAEFPLNADFARLSNNCSVGLTGKGRLIQSVARYLAQGGEYYSCDPKVQAELCIPLFDEDGAVLGILDAEAFAEDAFDEERLGLCIGLALWAQRLLARH
ncbi:histidine kinase [Gallaecimonas sp. GXIMD4217]|uniref:GAF domain-containing protein n=1 Tax=Gallaecimonas sp. GXIMD4217 TaxID=3131927 RepID=UPI00311B3128